MTTGALTYTRRNGHSVDHLYALAADGRPYRVGQLAMCGTRLGADPGETGSNRLCRRCEAAAAAMVDLLIVVDWDPAWNGQLRPPRRMPAPRRLTWTEARDARVAQHEAALAEILRADVVGDASAIRSEYIANLTDTSVALEMTMARLRARYDAQREDRRDNMDPDLLHRIDVVARAVSVAVDLDDAALEAWFTQ